MGALVTLIPDKEVKKRDLLLANPSAGGGRAARTLAHLKLFAKQHGWAVQFRETGSPEAITHEARRATAEGYSRIFVLGGDGTFQVVLNAVGAHADVALGIIPAGGGNDLAAALGLPIDAVRAAKILLDGEIGHLDAAKVRCAGGVERLYIAGGGVGLDAEAARYAGSVYRKVRGRWRYIFSGLHALLGFRGVHVRATVEGAVTTRWNAKALLLTVLNTPTYGAGLRMAPEARCDDGALDMVMLENLNFLQVLALLPRLAFRGELRTKHIRRARIKMVRIETAGECPFHGDGEIIGKTPVEIEVVPRAVKMMKPRENG